ncbi:unnamed protein product [Hermetia illucens]|uniref:Helitron helicase-like domain-containing protein n=1 Tax=Hermetia illucens TaxID=343691 RepID=A0A7R8V3F1_HERIL|nr:unnamed protein product [Hermetia illucens]
MEKARDALSKQKARSSKRYRREEKLRNREARQLIRRIRIYRTKEQIRGTEARREARKHSSFRDKERCRDKRLRQVARRNIEYRKVKRKRDLRARRSARSDPQYLLREISVETVRKQLHVTDWETVSKAYAKNVKGGYTHACHCCGRLWPIKSVRRITKASLIAKRKGNLTFTAEYIGSIFSLHTEEDSGIFCRTCTKSILANEIPKLTRVKGLVFPPIPDVLRDLTPLEDRLVSTRHIFLKIVRKGSGLGYQHALAGNVINVPVEVDIMVSILPRASSDNHIITVELKRKMCYKHGRKELIRPDKVRQAGSYLTNGNLFQDLGITLNDTWGNDVPLEDISERETMLDLEHDYTLVMAPGEGKTPLSLIYDDNMEELGFIKIHCGQKRIFKVKLSHLDIIKSELSREDRRAVRTDYLFTALKKQQYKSIKNNISICLRKKMLKGAPIFASNMLDAGFVSNLIQHDDGYRALSTIRNSPSHWEVEKKKVLAMIRQFGVPSLFITLSAAETRWPELLKMLKFTVDRENISEEEAVRLPYLEKARLIQSDPFICATYFEIPHSIRIE